MKEVIVEETVAHTEYVAYDGTQFKDKTECKRYEESALGVLMVKYRPYVVRQSTEERIFGHGTEDYFIDVVAVKDINAMETIMQIFLLENPHYKNPENASHLKRIHDRLQRAFDEEGYIFIGRGYREDEFWIMETLSEAIESIKNACTPEEQ